MRRFFPFLIVASLLVGLTGCVTGTDSKVTKDNAKEASAKVVKKKDSKAEKKNTSNSNAENSTASTANSNANSSASTQPSSNTSKTTDSPVTIMAKTTTAAQSTTNTASSSQPTESTPAQKSTPVPTPTPASASAPVPAPTPASETRSIDQLVQNIRNVTPGAFVYSDNDTVIVKNSSAGKVLTYPFGSTNALLGVVIRPGGYQGDVQLAAKCLSIISGVSSSSFESALDQFLANKAYGQYGDNIKIYWSSAANSRVIEW